MRAYMCVCVCVKNKKQKQKNALCACFFVLYAVSGYPTDFWVSIYLLLYTSSTLALASVVLPHHFGNQ